MEREGALGWRGGEEDRGKGRRIEGGGGLRRGRRIEGRGGG